MDGHGELAGRMKTNGAATPGVRSVVVNGEARRTEAFTLAELLADLGYGDARVATALNGDFVPARARSDATLSEGDRVEIVAPRQGG
jgi:sulfur carrier protein